jgi:xanthine dehydrogenase accessory factor
MNDMAKILKLLECRQDEPFVMATIIQVVGSSYRKVGGKLLLDRSGKIYGTISGGCIEEDLLHQAKEVFHEKKPKLINYDLQSEDDLGWGVSAGCNGSVSILLEFIQWNDPISEENSSLWKKIIFKLNSGVPVTVSKTYDQSLNLSESIYIAGDGDILYSSKLNQSRINQVKNFLSHQKRIVYQDESPFKKIIMEIYEPLDKLFIFGAGTDVEPVVKLLSKLDFEITIVDPREDRAKRDYFPTADEIIIDFPHRYLEINPIPTNSYILIMSHHFPWDYQLVQKLSLVYLNYIGVLGPKQRTERLFLSDSLPNIVHSPVGLPIHAEGPEEIAVSIAAELIKVRDTFRKSKRNSQTLINGNNK